MSECQKKELLTGFDRNSKSDLNNGNHIWKLLCFCIYYASDNRSILTAINKQNNAQARIWAYLNLTV